MVHFDPEGVAQEPADLLELPAPLDAQYFDGGHAGTRIGALYPPIGDDVETALDIGLVVDAATTTPATCRANPRGTEI